MVANGADNKAGVENMKVYGIDIEIKNVPVLDKDFVPIGKFNQAFLKAAKKPVSIAVVRNDNQTAVCSTFIHGTADMLEADIYYMDRLVKTILWMKGGYKIYVSGDETIYEQIKQAYSINGSLFFDANVMTLVYEQDFEVQYCNEVPERYETSKPIGRHLEGCRIGFDAGGSDRKVSAVIDGKAVFSEEVVWSNPLRHTCRESMQ